MAEMNEYINRTADPELLAEEQLAVLCSRNFKIAQWLVEPRANQLRYQGAREAVAAQPQSLEPRIMLLLCVLAANAGNVVSRNDLMAALWPKVVVNENSLTRAVSELRKALETPANEPEGLGLIDTIPKKGYRLNAAVSFSTPAALVSQATETAGTAHSFGYKARFAVAASLAFFAALLIWQLPMDLSGQPEMIAISSTDNRLFSQNEGTEADARNVEDEYSHAVQATQSVLSRNGDLFAYVSYNDSGSSLVLGSLSSFSSPVNVYETDELIFNLQWSPVDNILIFAQTPRFSPAALSPDKEVVRLVMFDISTMAATVLSGDQAGPAPRKPFSLT